MITVNYDLSLQLKGPRKKRQRRNCLWQLDLKATQSKKIREAIRAKHPGWILEGFSIVDNLLSVCKEQHQAIDTLFALLISKDEGFLPSESGQPWRALQQGNKAIKNAESQE